MSYKETLYGLDKKGGFKVWEVETGMLALNVAKITVTHGKDGGEMQEQHTTISVGKQGRDVHQQAEFEAKAKVKKQMDKGYRQTKAELEELPLIAMLAADYHKAGHRITYPALTSVKYDGVRCLAKCQSLGVVTLESRTGQPYNLPHIEKELAFIMNPGDVLDGEIYLHGEVLQDITSAVKRTDPQKEIDKAHRKMERGEDALGEYEEALKIARIRPLLEFHVFDIVGEQEISLPFSERLVKLRQYAELHFSNKNGIFITSYQIATSEEDMKKLHKQAVALGYEGLMIRNLTGLYESGKRSADLQKFKIFIDAEFPIIGYRFDKEGFIVFELRNDVNPKTFECIMGSQAWKRAIAEIIDSLVGHAYMTVAFQSRYKDTLLPQFPAGKVIRDGRVVGGQFIPDM